MALSALRCRSWQVSPSHDFRKSCIMHMKAVDGQDAFGTGNFFFSFTAVSEAALFNWQNLDPSYEYILGSFILCSKM